MPADPPAPASPERLPESVERALNTLDGAGYAAGNFGDTAKLEAAHANARAVIRSHVREREAAAEVRGIRLALGALRNEDANGNCLIEDGAEAVQRLLVERGEK